MGLTTASIVLEHDTLPLVPMMRQPSTIPQVTYYVESREQAEVAQKQKEVRSRGEWLQQNIGTDAVLARLAASRSRLAIALNQLEIEEDVAMTDFLRELSIRKIPLELWANLEDADGYWIHAGNVPIAEAAIEKMVGKLEASNVPVDAVGLDLEMPIGVLSAKGYASIRPFLNSPENAHDQLRKYIDRVLSEAALGVATYEIPVMGDMALTRRLFGIPRAPELSHERYRRVGLVYSSVPRPPMTAEHFVGAYSHGKGRIPALGIVSSGPENPGRDIDFTGLLDQPAFRRDMRVALSGSDKVYVFALNGMGVLHRTHEVVQAALKE